MKTAAEIVRAIDEMHPIERERLCECLSIGEASTSLLLSEIESRYDELIDADAIAATAKRIAEADAAFWEPEEQNKPPPGNETGAPARAPAESNSTEIPSYHDGANHGTPDRP